MERIKKILRIAGLVLLIILALSGIGIVPPPNRERYISKEVTTELVEEKKEGSEERKT
ncbi:MAG: hypothetical protein IPK96_20070 [Flammeovirgaceae bacterium]|jgi:hypothetical protein|nr:hypothetical protein [Flammeovirgaceae bacterium]